MTEKEIQEAADSEMSDQPVPEEEGQTQDPNLDQEEEEREEIESSLEEPQETEVLPEEETAEDETEEQEAPSDFLLKWQERHEAFLAGKTDQESESASQQQAQEDDGQKKPSLFKKKNQPKLDHLPINQEKLEEDTDKVKKKNPIPSELLWKTVPILSLALSLVIICLYFITPLGKSKQIVVTGNVHVDSSKIVEDSLIMQEDYILSTLINATGHENNVRNSSPWVKDASISYSFPNTFTITIQEYSQIGFVKEGESYYSVLSSGEISETATPQDQLPASYTTIQLTDRELIKKLVLQLATIKPAILAEIQDIQLTPSRATNDLLTLTMTSGHKILVPLSDIDFKLPYYEKIAPQLSVPSVIDMEVGIFSYAIQ